MRMARASHLRVRPLFRVSARTVCGALSSVVLLLWVISAAGAQDAFTLQPGVPLKKELAGDGLHLTDAGRLELVQMVSRALGRAPIGSVGACLPTRYTDDAG